MTPEIRMILEELCETGEEMILSYATDEPVETQLNKRLAFARVLEYTKKVLTTTQEPQ